MIAKSSKKILLATAASLLLGACLPVAGQYTGAGSATRNEVHLVRLTHEVNFGSAGTLPSEEVAALDAFAAQNELGYGDTVSIDFGDEDNPGVREAVYNVLEQRGIPLASEAPLFGPIPTAGTGTVFVERYVAVPPPCPNRTQNFSANFENVNSQNFGCSNRTNLALMIADPRHLVDGEDGGEPSGEWAAKVIRLHRSYEPRNLRRGRLRTNQ